MTRASDSNPVNSPMPIPSTASASIEQKNHTGSDAWSNFTGQKRNNARLVTTAKIVFTAAGLVRKPGIGMKLVAAPTRAITNRKPARTCAGTMKSSCIGRQVGEQTNRIGGKGPQHPGQQDQYACRECGQP